MAPENADNLKINVVDDQPCAVTLTVEIPHPDVAGETEKVYGQIQKSARIPGFRQGKAPMDLVKKNYTSSAREQVIDNLIHRTAFSALKSKGVVPVDTPRIEEIVFDFDKPFSYRMRAERHPQFTVKDYKGLKIKKEIHPVTEERIAKGIDALRERNARLEASKADTVSPTHFVQISYEAFVDGAPVKDMKADNQLVDLSAPQGLPGFKEGVIGMKKGEARDVKVTFPAESENKALAGKEVIFKVTVTEIKDKVLPAADDEFAKDLNAASLDELKGKIRETFESSEKKREQQETEKQIAEQLLAANAFPVPESLVDEQLSQMLTRMVEYLRRQGMPDAAIQKHIEELRTKYRQEAENNVRVSYILNAVADAEKIDVSEDDLNKELARMKGSNAGRETEVDSYFAEHKSSIAAHLKEEKIFSFLIENAKIKEEIKEHTDSAEEK